MNCIVVEGLEKRYGDVEALAGISFTVDEGEVFALLGPNRAGKTTTVEILEGHRPRSAGRVEVLGFDPQTGGRRFRSRIGIVLQEAGLDGAMVVSEAMALFAGFYPHPRDVSDLVTLAGLADKVDARVASLSGGQRRRLDLALALVGDPDLLFLDEPTTGFDPEARRQAWEMLDALRALGKTILLTTHYMDEVQRLANRGVRRPDRRVGDTGESRRSRRRTARIVFRLPGGASVSDLPDVPGQLRVASSGEEVVISTDHPTRALMILASWATARGDELEGLSVARPSLEDVYLDLVGVSTGQHDNGSRSDNGRRAR